MITLSFRITNRLRQQPECLTPFFRTHLQEPKKSCNICLLCAMNLKLDEKIVATSGSSAWEFFRGPKGPANDDVDSTRLRPKGRSLLVHNEIVLGNERVANISDVNWLVSPSVGNPDAIVFPALRQPDSELAVPRAVVPDFRLVPEPVK